VRLTTATTVTELVLQVVLHNLLDLRALKMRSLLLRELELLIITAMDMELASHQVPRSQPDLLVSVGLLRTVLVLLTTATVTEQASLGELSRLVFFLLGELSLLGRGSLKWAVSKRWTDLAFKILWMWCCLLLVYTFCSFLVW
jgi:hypothetical protein